MRNFQARKKQAHQMINYLLERTTLYYADRMRLVVSPVRITALKSLGISNFAIQVGNAPDAVSLAKQRLDGCQLLEPGKKYYPRVEDLYLSLKEASQAVKDCGF